MKHIPTCKPGIDMVNCNCKCHKKNQKKTVQMKNPYVLPFKIDITDMYKHYKFLNPSKLMPKYKLIDSRKPKKGYAPGIAYGTYKEMTYLCNKLNKKANP